MLVVRAHYFNTPHTVGQIRNMGFTFYTSFYSYFYMSSNPIQLETLKDPSCRPATLAFLKKKTFHQTLRNEILFAVAPQSLKSCVEQRENVLKVMDSLVCGGFLRDEGFKMLGTMIEMTKVSDEDLIFSLISCTIDQFCQSGKLLNDQTEFILQKSGSGQWPILIVGQAPDFHVVTLKGHKTENGVLKLNIRDSARDPSNAAEIWIEKNNSSNNLMNLATDMCIFFEL